MKVDIEREAQKANGLVLVSQLQVFQVFKYDQEGSILEHYRI